MQILTIVYLVLVMSTYSNVVAGTIDTSSQAPYEQCGYCHEYDGNSKIPNYPRLAGQQRLYLVKQLNDFKSGKRKGSMQATAELLSDADVKIVADYFSQQKLKMDPAITTPGFKLAKKLYFEGDEGRGLNSCAGCHGPKGMGGGVIPRIVGQHKDYLRTQLLAFKARDRKNDEAGFMRDVVEKLTASEIEVLASYLASTKVLDK